MAAQQPPAAGIAGPKTPVGGVAAQKTPVGGVAAQKTPVGGLAAQSDPTVDIDDDLAIPVEPAKSRAPSPAAAAASSPAAPAASAGVSPAATAASSASTAAVSPASAAASLASTVGAPFAAPVGASPAPLGGAAEPLELGTAGAMGVPLTATPALPFAAPAAPPARSETAGRFDDLSTSPRAMPRASTDTTPLPPPPLGIVGSADEPAPVEHPRVPSEWLADRGESRPVGAVRGKDPSAEEAALVAGPARGGALAPKKLMMIGGGVAAVALVLTIALTRGGSSKQHARGTSPAKGSAVAMAGGGGSAVEAGEPGDSTSSMQQPHSRHGTPHGANVATGGSAEPAAGSSDETVAGSDATGSADAGSDEGSAAAAPAPKHHPTLGGKQVVLEYDNAAHAAPAPAPAAKEDTAAVDKAREAYALGNQRLFAGDAAGAVRAYQQALDHYPGYVAGYRGLGLAYSQQGDKTKALQAFHTYLASVPGARDAALIKKRVAALAH